MKYYDACNLKCLDINLHEIYCGNEVCLPGKFFGPYIRDSYVIHYVEQGTGFLELSNKRYTLLPGEIFFIPPHVMSYYEADKNNPWIYKWVGIQADNIKTFFDSLGLSVDSPIMNANNSISYAIDKIIAASMDSSSITYTATTYNFLAALAGCSTKKIVHKPNSKLYVENAIDYIWKYIYKKITVSELANYINVDRSYLTAIFKNHTGISPKQYITISKIKTACEYLKSTDYDITRVAHSVGYEDLFAFSHVFKKEVGISPKQYRENK